MTSVLGSKLLLLKSIPVSWVVLGRSNLLNTRSICCSCSSDTIAFYSLTDWFNGVPFGRIVSISILRCFRQVIEIRLDHLLRIPTLLHKWIGEILYTRFLFNQLFVLVNNLDPCHKKWLLLLCGFDVIIVVLATDIFLYQLFFAQSFV